MEEMTWQWQMYYVFLEHFNPVFIFSHLDVSFVYLLAQPIGVSMSIDNFP
jgi:hypothetical protein